MMASNSPSHVSTATSLGTGSLRTFNAWSTCEWCSTEWLQTSPRATISAENRTSLQPMSPHAFKSIRLLLPSSTTSILSQGPHQIINSQAATTVKDTWLVCHSAARSDQQGGKQLNAGCCHHAHIGPPPLSLFRAKFTGEAAEILQWILASWQNS